jgi:hypothetical protein
MKTRVLLAMVLSLLVLTAGFKPAPTCETRCEVLYNGCLAGYPPSVCESSFCNCMLRCTSDPNCILP